MVQIEELVLGLSNRFLVFMGRDDYRNPVFAGKVGDTVYWIGNEDVSRVFQASAPTRIHHFQGTEEQRKAVVSKAIANLNEDTFGLMLNWATKPKASGAKQQGSGSDWGAVAGGVLLSAAVIALIAALFSKDE